MFEYLINFFDKKLAYLVKCLYICGKLWDMDVTKKFVSDYFLIDFLNQIKKDVIDESGKIPYYEKVQKIKDRGVREYLLIIDYDKDYCYVCDK